ncbi:MAG: NAD(P)/FAD-dependent oxidoreductase [Acidimicrobiales bacterium]
MIDFDVIVVGSGMNSLVCAAMLAKSGATVAVLERNDRLGGCIRTEELFPGYLHDVLSSWYPLFVGGPAYAELADELHSEGLEFANTESPTAVLTPQGESLVLSTDSPSNKERMEALSKGDGDSFVQTLDSFFSNDANLTFGLLGSDLRQRATVNLLAKEIRTRKLTGTIEFAGSALESCRNWLEREFDSEVLRALIAPWVLHAGLGPDDAHSGLMGKVIIGSVATGGLPVVVGGSHRIVEAFSAVISNHGGTTMIGARVDKVVTARGRARGVVTADGRHFNADRAIVCNLTPQQLYGELLSKNDVPDAIGQHAEQFRFGRAAMQIHYALERPPTWADDDLAQTAMIHLTAGLDGVSRAVNEATRGLLPAEATIVVGQPTVVDPTRAPEGAAILWIQLQELPRNIRGDAAGTIDVGDGTWTTEIAERYADRIEERLVRHLPDLRSIIVGRKVFSPQHLQALNPNLVGGDPYSGACTIDQSLFWRPSATTKNHTTPVKSLYHIGASTHPGPGLGGASGYLVAKALS